MDQALGVVLIHTSRLTHPSLDPGYWTILLGAPPRYVKTAGQMIGRYIAWTITDAREASLVLSVSLRKLAM